MQALIDHDWPGNVRELENTLRGALAITEGSVIGIGSLPPQIAPRPATVARSAAIDIELPLSKVSEDLIATVESEYLSRLLRKHSGNLTKVAFQSGLSRKSVLQKLRRHGLSRVDFKPSTRGKNAGKDAVGEIKATARP